MSLLLKHFWQSLRGIGAMDSFGHGSKRRVTVKRTQYLHSHYARMGWLFTPSYGQPERIESVEISVRPDWSPDAGAIEVTYAYTYTIPGYQSYRYPNRWMMPRTDTAYRTAVFRNPIKAAEYVAAWLGYVPEPVCDCHRGDCELAA